MRALIVFAHPNRKSLNGAFLEKTLKGLEANPDISEVEILDLYKENFDFALRFDENRRRRDMHRDPYMASYRNQLTRADLIIYIYPIWWGRPPAILLGYFDRLMATEFAYRYHPGKIMPEGLLKGKQVICISTMKGPSLYPALWLGNAHKMLMRKALFNFVGIKKVKFLQWGDMEGRDGKRMKALVRTEKVLTDLKARTA